MRHHRIIWHRNARILHHEHYLHVRFIRKALQQAKGQSSLNWLKGYELLASTMTTVHRGKQMHYYITIVYQATTMAV